MTISSCPFLVDRMKEPLGGVLDATERDATTMAVSLPSEETRHRDAAHCAPSSQEPSPSPVHCPGAGVVAAVGELRGDGVRWESNGKGLDWKCSWWFILNQLG